MDDLLVDLALVLVVCGLALLIPMSDHTRVVTGVVLALASMVPMAVAVARMARRGRQR